MTEEISAQAEEKAREASTPERFSFVDRLASRDYPTEVIEIYLDEAAAYRMARLESQLSVTTDGDQANVIQEQIEYLRRKAIASRYLLHLEGISSEEYDAVVDEATAEFPLEYVDSRNPLTFKTDRTVVENPDREAFFRIHLWAKFIRKVEDAEGRIDDNIDAEWVAQLNKKAPLMALVKIQGAVELLRMTTDWMDKIQDEDFLVKS